MVLGKDTQLPWPKTDLADNIATAIDTKLHTVSVFLYLKKVIDTIDHSLLLKKLGHYGIRGIAN